MMLFVHMSQLWGDGPWAYLQQQVLPEDGCRGVARSSCGCPSYWWTNILYIQNFYPAGDQNNECMSWTWYLANDMQMYIVSPFVVMAMQRWRRAGMVLWSMLMLASLGLPFALAYAYNLTVSIW